MPVSHGKSETAFARDRVTELLEESRFELVSEGFDAADGWRGEFLRESDDDGVILVVHKPDGAPYVSVETLIDLDPPDEVESLHGIIDVVSDYDVSFYFRPDERPSCHLGSRLFVSSLHREDFGFALGNLLFCREALRDHARAGDDRGAEETGEEGAAP